MFILLRKQHLKNMAHQPFSRIFLKVDYTYVLKVIKEGGFIKMDYTYVLKVIKEGGFIKVLHICSQGNQGRRVHQGRLHICSQGNQGRRVHQGRLHICSQGNQGRRGSSRSTTHIFSRYISIKFEKVEFNNA